MEGKNGETKTRRNRFETALKRNGNTSNTQKRRSKSALLNFFSIFWTTINSYIQAVCNVILCSRLTIKVTCVGTDYNYMLH